MSLLHKVSDLALRHLPEARFAQLRRFYMGMRKRLAGASRLVYGSFDTADLRAHLEGRLGRGFEVLMVHSSVNHMLPMYSGNALELVRMLIDFCGPERTLAMPAFYFGESKLGGAWQTFRQNPVFDLRRTPSQMGLATEIFRRTKGVVQSRHPVYRISALGPLARELTEGHERAQTSAGAGTPFERMAARDTLILGIGKSFHVMTQVHHVDDLLGDAFPVPRRTPAEGSPLVVTLIDGDERIQVPMQGGGFAWRFNVAKLPQLVRPGDLDLWRFHHVPMAAARARRITDRLIEAAHRGQTLYDPD